MEKNIKPILLILLVAGAVILAAIYFLFFNRKCLEEMEEVGSGRNCCSGLIIKTGKLGIPFCVTPGTMID